MRMDIPAFCHRVVDMISLGVNSLDAHNNTLCWSLIPKSSGGELLCTITFEEVQELEAVMQLLEIFV